MKKICYFSGKRGGFGALRLTLEGIQSSPLFELQVVVSDMHLSDTFGATAQEVEKYFKIAGRVPIDQKGGSSVDRSEALGVCLSGCARVFADLQPDLLLILGDRGETLTAACAAVNLGIPICHIEGGDKTGNLDEWFRHAITKLSHVHLVAHEEARDRVIRMGEESNRVHVVGDAHLDLISHNRFTPIGEAQAKYGVEGRRYVIVLQHPVSTDPTSSYDEMKSTLQAVRRVLREDDMHAIVIYPCSDQGYEGTVCAITDHAGPYSTVFKNIDSSDFLGLLGGATCLVGNSSSGIKETPLFRVPTVNIGSRQEGRKRSENVFDVAHDEEIIYKTLKLVCQRGYRLPEKLSFPYGEGHVAENTLRILESLSFETLFAKKMTY